MQKVVLLQQTHKQQIPDITLVHISLVATNIWPLFCCR